MPDKTMPSNVPALPMLNDADLDIIDLAQVEKVRTDQGTDYAGYHA